MTKYYALIGPKLDGPALNSAMTACSIEPSIRQVPRIYVNRMSTPVSLPRSHYTKIQVKKAYCQAQTKLSQIWHG